MNFAHPNIFLLLWAVVPLMMMAYWGISRRKKILSGYAVGEGLNRLTGDASPSRRTIGAVLLILAAATALIALAGPRYGYHWEKIEQKGVDIMVALDCSRSMMAEDIKPSRLTRAKYEIIDLLRMLSGDRIGLVAFAGTAFLQCPLTMDYSAFHLFLESLTPDMLPVGGTNLGDALKTAMTGFNAKDDSDKAVILITDGETTTGPDPLETARQAAEKKIKIFCIGVGQDQGAPVPQGSGGFKKDKEGKIVLTRLDEETLKKMAAITGGIYVRSVAGDMDLEMIYKDKIRGTMKQTTLESGRKKIWEDRFQWFLAVALLFLAIEMIVPKGRGAVVLLLLLIAAGAGVPDARAENVYKAVEQGRTAYNGQAYEKALKHFIDAQLADPENAELYYNIGSAYYKGEKYGEAADSYKKALDLVKDNDQLKENAWYNLGNSRFRQNDFKGAIEAYQKALTINAKDKEAEENLALAKKAAEEKKKQQEQQKNQDKQQKQNKDQNKEQQQKDQQQQGKQQQKKDNSQQSKNGNNDKSKPEQKQQSSSGQDKHKQEKQDENHRKNGGNQHEPEKQPAAKQEPQQQGQQQAGAAAGMTDKGENRLNRLKDLPGGAMIIPDYRKREVERDW